MSDFEHYAYSLAWIAFREDSLLATMREAEKRGGFDAALTTLVAASRLAFGETETGPHRRDQRPYIHRVGGPGDTAYRLQRELRLGHIRSRTATSDHHPLPPEAWGTDVVIMFGHDDVFIRTRPPLQPGRVDDPLGVECHIGDVRNRFDRAFSLHNFQGEWKPIPHLDMEPADATRPAPVVMESLEMQAASSLAQHLATLQPGDREAFRREDAKTLLNERYALSSRAFDRVWAAGRRKAGLTLRASAGRKPGGKSPRLGR